MVEPMINMKSAVTVVLTLLAFATQAQAWEVAGSCGGRIYKGTHSNHTWSIDGCSVNASQNAAIRDAQAAWERVNGMHNRFKVKDTRGDCRVNSGDGKWEIHIAPPTMSWLDGDAGTSRSRYNWCWWFGNGDVFENDIVVSSDLVSIRLDPLDQDLGLREVVLHEVGHALGADHSVHGIMCDSDFGTCGKFGDRDRFGNLGTESSESLMPDEIRFGHRWHADSESDAVDAAVSAFTWLQSYPQIGNYAPLQQLCHGDTFSVRVSVANLGQGNLSTTGIVVLSTNKIISVYDTEALAFDYNRNGPGRNEGVFDVTVPNHLLRGITYHIGLVIDHTDSVSEIVEHNNSVRTGGQILIRPASVCSGPS